jgi:hypothetical protein
VRRCPVASHPQYTGILLAVFGQITRWPTIITLALFPVIALAYVRLALSEEKDMIDRFASYYEGYMQRGPRFARGEADGIKSPHKRGRYLLRRYRFPLAAGQHNTSRKARMASPDVLTVGMPPNSWR